MSSYGRTKVDLSEYYGTFSGGDMIVYILFPHARPIPLGELTTVSYSIFREKVPLRTLGRISPSGYGKGPRTVAGTMIFTVLNKHITNRIKEEVPYLKNIGRLKTDELPPFDLVVTFGNEFGASARLVITGVTITDEGKIMSVEDMFTENTMSYMARDIDLMDGPWTEQMATYSSNVLNKEAGISQLTAKFNLDDLTYSREAERLARERADYLAGLADDEAKRNAYNSALDKVDQGHTAPSPSNTKHPGNSSSEPTDGYMTVNVTVRGPSTTLAGARVEVVSKGIVTQTNSKGKCTIRIKMKAGETIGYGIKASAKNHLHNVEYIRCRPHESGSVVITLKEIVRTEAGCIKDFVPVTMTGIGSTASISGGAFPKFKAKCISKSGAALANVTVEFTYKIVGKGLPWEMKAKGSLGKVTTGSDGIAAKCFLPERRYRPGGGGLPGGTSSSSLSISSSCPIVKLPAGTQVTIWAKVVRSSPAYFGPPITWKLKTT